MGELKHLGFIRRRIGLVDYEEFWNLISPYLSQNHSDCFELGLGVGSRGINHMDQKIGQAD
jgi:hypothetical protein